MIDRRMLLLAAGGAALMPSLGAGATKSKQDDAPSASADRPRRRRSRLFMDTWYLEHQHNVALRQSVPKYVPEATYEDPLLDYLASWPTVWRDQAAGVWRMVYPISGFPLSLMGAVSDDGIHWRPMDASKIDPGGKKAAPHHLLTIPNANGGPVYIDPSPQAEAAGERFKLYATPGGLVYVSADGLNWRRAENASWNIAGGRWRPDPPMCGYYIPERDQHVMVTRPGHGDRRIATITSPDALTWDDLQLKLMPDPLDDPQVQLYGMPVHRYEDIYIGFLYRAYFANADRLKRFNQLWGAVDCELAYSFDGLNWQRGLRQSLIPLSDPGQVGAGIIYPSALVEHEDELRIYSATTPDLHVQYSHDKGQYLPKGTRPPSSLTLHTLRRDGFTYLESSGNWATFITKPFTLMQPGLQLNAMGPYGEVSYQFTDMQSKPLKGYGFKDCVPFREDDQVRFDLKFKNRDTTDLLGKVIRLEVRFRNTRLYALRGDLHFCDAMDVALLNDNKPINPNWMDY